MVTMFILLDGRLALGKCLCDILKLGDFMPKGLVGLLQMNDDPLCEERESCQYLNELAILRLRKNWSVPYKSTAHGC